MCLATYEIFPGFDAAMVTSRPPTTSSSTTTSTMATNILIDDDATTTEAPVNSTKHAKFKCPEEENPSNIGPYEVPTQRDLALLTRKTLRRMFGSYHQKALFFLDDIKKATRATVEMEKKCPSNKLLYRQCVKNVSNQCEIIIKSLVVSLEKQRHDVAVFSEGSICSMSAMKEDPMKLIKILAMEDASLEFALPAFLRLLSACSNYCISSFKEALKPLRHMTDTDLVVRHFLTHKDYQQLIV